MIALGTPRELIASLGAEHVVAFAVAGGRRPPDLEALRRLPGVHDARAENGTMLLTATEVHLAIPALLAALSRDGLELSLLTTHSATLEDVFVSLTGRHLRDT
jgi:ABC-2 type transport system ATP-binding protein